MRLFCFPYAGAGAAVFRHWLDHLPSCIELCIPCLPGRDARIDDAPASTMAPLVTALAREMLPLLDIPYALFGHSMGAFIAFDVSHELSALGRKPAHLFVSAQRGPSLPYADRPLFALPDNEFLAAILARYDNIPKAVLAEKDLMELLLRTLRGDFTLVEDYKYRATQRLDCPLTVFGGLDDKRITPEQLQAWREETSNHFRLHLMPGGHFFLHDSREELLSVIRAQLQSVIRAQLESVIRAQLEADSRRY